MFGPVLERLFLVHDFAVDLAFAFVPTRTRLAEYHNQKDCWKKNCRCLGGVEASSWARNIGSHCNTSGSVMARLALPRAVDNFLFIMILVSVTGS